MTITAKGRSLAGSRDRSTVPDQAELAQQVARHRATGEELSARNRLTDADQPVTRDGPSVSDQPTSRDRPTVPSQPENATDSTLLSDAARRLSAADERRLRALEALPAGHPSSPYLADGRRRDPEPSLRSMELPLPADKQGGDDRPPRSDEPSAPEASHFSYWNEVPRFKQMWADHLERWPGGPAATVDRSHDPPGSWRSDSDLLLSPEVHAQTKDAIGRIHESEPQVTNDLRKVVQDSLLDAELVGQEFRLKGEDRLKEKVAERLKHEPDRAPDDVIQGIHDTIRYTVRLRSEEYVTGYWDLSQRLSVDGYEMYERKNHWEDSEYKGINTRWMTPEGQRFEVQFHTAESYHAKQEITHDAYERVRNRLIDSDERGELEAFEREVSSWVSVPADAPGIPNYRRGDS